MLSFNRGFLLLRDLTGKLFINHFERSDFGQVYKNDRRKIIANLGCRENGFTDKLMLKTLVKTNDLKYLRLKTYVTNNFSQTLIYLSASFQ
ncbi:CLUMA_CG010951, isoform A [Clunio marinus]|uniref:CLUMA_CG010951, isoform A n=1 Tax=Clunio marinus TaxID=568069 RepID=A0A1J1IBA5_9DIPT|nr:CLUMA_CG010951, isoform A [Clunio marinus]